MALKRKLSFITGAVLLSSAVVLGILQLFELRFRSGDIFPAYSSYRADPKGAKILYESLAEYPDIQTQRLVKPLNDEMASAQTVLFLGCADHSTIQQFDEVLDPFLKAGGHAVLAFSPVESTFYSHKHKECDEDGLSETNAVPVLEFEPSDDGAGPTEETGIKEDGSKEKSKHNSKTCLACQQREREERWQVELDRFTVKEMKALDPEEYASPVVEDRSLSPLPWQTALYFKDLGAEWTVIYEFLGKPAVIERNWGKGSIILIADSYLFSNEALVIDRHTSVIVRMLGSPTHILFDELHLGVQSREGVMMLINRYRLTGVLFAVLLLIGLFVWQRASSFIPKYTNPNDEGDDIGMTVDSHQGFTNLLVRHIPQKELMKTMIEEWRSTYGRQPVMKSKIEKMELEVRHMNYADNKEHPMDTYNRLLKNLNERK